MTLTVRVGELEVQVQDLSSSLAQKDKDVEVYTFVSLEFEMTFSVAAGLYQNVNKPPLLPFLSLRLYHLVYLYFCM